MPELSGQTVTPVDVRAVPLTPTTYWLDCNQCGPLEVVIRPLVKHAAFEHLRSHGVETPEEAVTHIPCQCGYDYALPTGDDTDSATCTVCSWTAYGMAADHLGHHHYLNTGHAWLLHIKEHA